MPLGSLAPSKIILPHRLGSPGGPRLEATARTRSDVRRPLDRAIHELVRFRRLACRDHAIVLRGEPADRVRGCRIAGQSERLAAAAAPIHLLSSERAGAARLLHPVGSPEARE